MQTENNLDLATDEIYPDRALTDIEILDTKVYDNWFLELQRRSKFVLNRIADYVFYYPAAAVNSFFTPDYEKRLIKYERELKRQQQREAAAAAKLANAAAAAATAEES